MSKIILTTPEELTGIIKNAVEQSLKPNMGGELQSRGNMLAIKDAIIFLRNNGFPTSKGKIYELTSSGKIPYKKYGNKLIFDKNDLLDWAHKQVISAQNSSELKNYLLGRKR